nr:hypothetical protein [uncultured Rhodopila sp.]
MSAWQHQPAMLIWPAPPAIVPAVMPAFDAIAEAERARAEARISWTIAASRAAPSLPLWVISGVAAMIANETSDSDLLLILADNLVAMAEMAEAGGEAPIGRELRTLADLPRGVAPLRAGVN